MKQRIKRIIAVVIALAVVFWIVDKIPFNTKIDLEISANIYQNSQVSGQTTVTLTGEKSNYLFNPADQFVGWFYLPLVEATADEGLQTSIKWSLRRDENLRHLGFFRVGDFVLAEDLGIVPYLLTSEDLSQFALMLTDGRIVATSDELAELYTKHITWHGDTTSTTITGANVIPEID